MNYSFIIYTICIMISAIGVSGINFDGIIKKNKYIEVRILATILSIALGYLVGNFIIIFLKLA